MRWSLCCHLCNHTDFSWFQALFSAAIACVSWSSKKAVPECTLLMRFMFCDPEFLISAARSSLWSCACPHASHMVWDSSHLCGTTCMVVPRSLPNVCHRSHIGKLLVCLLSCSNARKGLLQYIKLHHNCVWKHIGPLGRKSAQSCCVILVSYGHS